MDNKTLVTFLLLVFGAVFFLTQFLIVPSFGSSQEEIRRLRQRLQSLDAEEPIEVPINLLRERFRRNPSRLEDVMGRIPGMRALARSLETPGHSASGYVYILASLAMASLGSLGVWFFTGSIPVSAGSAVMFGSMPVLKLRFDQNRRFTLFEQQLVGALDIMIRALQTGYPFTETLRHVAREMEDPISTEFQIAFDEINVGVDVRTALRNMLNRMPSMSLMAISTTVVLQRETGGNLSETLFNISGVIRGRFKFQRRVKTLTAEGRMSAWVLALTPFALFLLMLVQAPAMMLDFVHNPNGQDMIAVAMGLMGLGVVWLRKLLAIDV